jgi:hypothetical protein
MKGGTKHYFFDKISEKTGDFSANLDIKKQKTCFNITPKYKKIFIEPENKRYAFLVFSLVLD